jgi:hypothetical protein
MRANVGATHAGERPRFITHEMGGKLLADTMSDQVKEL